MLFSPILAAPLLTTGDMFVPLTGVEGATQLGTASITTGSSLTLIGVLGTVQLGTVVTADNVTVLSSGVQGTIPNPLAAATIWNRIPTSGNG